MKTAYLSLLAASLPAMNVCAQTSRPNVLFILADDLGYGDIGCYGAIGVNTPCLDSLARTGIRFTDAHAMASTSTPSRYALLTGENAYRKAGTDVAAGNAGMIISPDQFTMADAFRSAGYRTGAIGKWHLGLGAETAKQDWNGTVSPALESLGFDYHYIMAATADRVPCVFLEQGRVANYDASAPISVSYRQNFEGEPTGRSNPELLTNLRPSHGHDMSIVNGISRIGYMKGGGKALWRDEDIADSIAAHALRFIADATTDGKPFFLYLATNDIHVPRFPHPRFRGKSTMGLRGDAIAQLDWTVGYVMAALDSLGISDNTLIVFTSDNGPVVDDGYDDRAEELLGAHRPAGPFRGMKYSAFEGGTAIPFIVSWPARIRGGQTSAALVTQVDLMRSLATLIGTTIPQKTAPDSRDQLATFLGQDLVGRDYVVEYAANHLLTVRTKRWKYIPANNGSAMITWGPKIETGNLPQPQLYDMTAPWEQYNQAEEHPDVVNALQNILESELAPR
ncbi:MAG: arylsulfatase [Bacteroidaceae bacterium]|nr:arylsulfatase [Bacteroidaceae bacterium]